jgi:hypothetical protein
MAETLNGFYPELPGWFRSEPVPECGGWPEPESGLPCEDCGADALTACGCSETERGEA